MNKIIFTAAFVLCAFANAGSSFNTSAIPPVDGSNPNSFYGDAFKIWLERLLHPQYLPAPKDEAMSEVCPVEAKGDEEQSQEPSEEESREENDDSASKTEDEQSSSDESAQNESGDEPSKAEDDSNEQSDESSQSEPNAQSDDGESEGEQEGPKAQAPGENEGEGDGRKPGQKPGLSSDPSDNELIEYVARKLGLKAKKGSDGKKGAALGSRARDDGDEKFATHDQDFKPVDSVELDQDNPLVELLVAQLIRAKIDLGLASKELVVSIGAIDKIVDFLNKPFLLQAYLVMRDVHVKGAASLATWYRRIQELSRSDLAQTYAELEKMRAYLRSLRVFWRHPKLEEAVTFVGSILHDLQLQTIKDPDQALAAQLFQVLPSVGRAYLRQMYDFDEIGDNEGARLLSAHLAEGRLQHLELVASLVEDAKNQLRIVNDAESFRATKMWIDDDGKAVGRDMLPFRSVRELGRTVRGQPGKDLEHNIVEGTAFVRKTKKRSEVASSEGSKREPVILTVIALDISGSMHGGVGLYQNAFATAFVLNALSARSDSGRRYHQVVIFPFDHRVHEPIWIRNAKDVFELIENYPSLLKNQEGNTDVTKVLLEALELIRSRAKNGNLSFKKANILLLTDGLSSLDAQSIRAKRDSILHPVQLFVLNFRDENPKFRQLATDKSMHFNHGTFTAVTTQDIKLKLSRYRKQRETKFFSSLSPSLLPSGLRQRIEAGTVLFDEVVSEQRIGMQECDSTLFEEFIADAEPKIKTASSRMERFITQANAFLRRNHELLQGEDSLLNCYLVTVKSYLKQEIHLKRLQLNEKILQALREMYRLTLALGHASRANLPNVSLKPIYLPKSDEFDSPIFSLFPGDYRKTCEDCQVLETGAMTCKCEKGWGASETTLENAADCFTSIENSRGVLGCMPGGDYLRSCFDCWFDQNDMLVCRCNYRNTYLENGRGCLYADYRNDQLVCLKRRSKT